MSPDRHVVLPLSVHSLAVSDNYCTLYTCCSNVHCLHILCHYLFHTHKNENDQRELPHAPHTTPLTCPSVSAPEPAAPGWGGDILFPSPNTFSRALLHKISPLPPVSSVFFSLWLSHSLGFHVTLAPSDYPQGIQVRSLPYVMQPMPRCSASACWWRMRASGLLLHQELWLGI